MCIYGVANFGIATTRVTPVSHTIRLAQAIAYHESISKVFEGQTIAVFFLAGLCEIGGGWLVWQAIREKRPSWWIVPGVLLLGAYGFVTPGLLPEVSSAEFGRAFAVYGGIFIAMSLAWAARLDGFVPDAGDQAGACVVVVGVSIMWWYPR